MTLIKDFMPVEYYTTGTVCRHEIASCEFKRCPGCGADSPEPRVFVKSFFNLEGKYVEMWVTEEEYDEIQNSYYDEMYGGN